LTRSAVSRISRRRIWLLAGLVACGEQRPAAHGSLSRAAQRT
jgi:hypothetical protein